MIYVGEFDEYSDEPQKFTHFIIPNIGSQDFKEVYSFSPMSNPNLTQFKKSNGIINKRYSNVERVQNSEIVGILIGTVVCDNHMEIINALKR